jgi:hypothetical protein
MGGGAVAARASMIKCAARSSDEVLTPKGDTVRWRLARPRSKECLFAIGMGLMAVSACSSPAPSPGAAIPVTLRDYRILALVTSAPAGVVSFDVLNRGPSTHEFVVFQTDRPADQLPLGGDGLTVDEDSPELHNVGEFAEVDIGRTAALSLRLSPGAYVLACNLEGHYLGGMYLAITVH